MLRRHAPISSSCWCGLPRSSCLPFQLPTTPRSSGVILAVSPIATTRVQHIHNLDDDRYTYGTFQDHIENKLDGIQIERRERGRIYHKNQQKLWPTLTELERDMTQASFAPAERLAPELLPRDVAELQLEGRMPESFGLLSSTNTDDDPSSSMLVKQKSRQDASRVENVAGSSSRTDTLLLEHETTTTRTSQQASQGAEPDEQQSTASSDHDIDDLAAMQFSQDTTTPSKRQQHDKKSRILADLRSNNIQSKQDEDVVTSWAAVGLDPLVEARCIQLVGRGATRSQSRLMPALLNEDHNDVLFGSVTGSGKTIAMLLSLIQGIRNETAGLNIFVAADEVNAGRALDFVQRFNSHHQPTTTAAAEKINNINSSNNNNNILDVPLESRWWYLAVHREKVEMYFRDLSRSLRNDDGSTRLLVCTADVLCELLFEKRMEFAPFGNLRRLYVDDIGKDIRFAKPDATMAEKVKDYTHPSATQLALATVHQLMPPDQRSLLQIGCATADMESDLSRHLLQTCVKPSAYTLIACAARLPATLHCVFSFCVTRTPLVSSDTQRNYFDYLARLLRNAAPAIPGRVLVFFPVDQDLLAVKARLMKDYGLDAKLLFEVRNGNNNINNTNSGSGNTFTWRQEGWRYLLLHEHDGFGLDIPLVSHVVLTFCPRNRFSLLHLAGRAARGGQPGWVFCVTPREEARNVANVCKELDVDVATSTIDVNLKNVPPQTVERWIRPPPEWGMDPQSVVKSRYEKFEDPIADMSHASMFQHSPGRRNKDMQLERDDHDHDDDGGGDDNFGDPSSSSSSSSGGGGGVATRRFQQVKKLHRDIAMEPALAVRMAREGLLDPTSLKPTSKLYRMLDEEGDKEFRYKTQIRKEREKRLFRGGDYDDDDE